MKRRMRVTAAGAQLEFPQAALSWIFSTEGPAARQRREILSILGIDPAAFREAAIRAGARPELLEEELPPRPPKQPQPPRPPRPPRAPKPPMPPESREEMLARLSRVRAGNIARSRAKRRAGWRAEGLSEDEVWAREERHGVKLERYRADKARVRSKCLEQPAPE